MSTNNLKIAQLEAKLKPFNSLQHLPKPEIGWLKTIRISLGISLTQLGEKLGITKQSALDLEKREVDESISLKRLREAAHALDMEFVYGLVPKDGSLDKLIDRKAQALAKKIVMRTARNMELEDQGNSKASIQKAIEDRKQRLKFELNKKLWD